MVVERFALRVGRSLAYDDASRRIPDAAVHRSVDCESYGIAWPISHVSMCSSLTRPAQLRRVQQPATRVNEMSERMKLRRSYGVVSGDLFDRRLEVLNGSIRNVERRS